MKKGLLSANNVITNSKAQLPSPSPKKIAVWNLILEKMESHGGSLDVR